MKKKKLSKSLKVLIISSIIIITFTLLVLYLMAFLQMVEPSTLILSFFGFFGVAEGINGAITHTKAKGENRINEIKERKEPCNNELDNS